MTLLVSLFIAIRKCSSYLSRRKDQILSRVTYDSTNLYKKRPRKIIKPTLETEPVKSACGSCPCWLIFVLTILALIGLIALTLLGSMYYKKNFITDIPITRSNENEINSNKRGLSLNSNKINSLQVSRVQSYISSNVQCLQGFFKSNGKCLRCPNGSAWNGTNCVRRLIVPTKTKVRTNHPIIYSNK
jgi:hypothetical protein